MCQQCFSIELYLTSGVWLIFESAREDEWARESEGGNDAGAFNANVLYRCDGKIFYLYILVSFGTRHIILCHHIFSRWLLHLLLFRILLKHRHRTTITTFACRLFAMKICTSSWIFCFVMVGVAPNNVLASTQNQLKCAEKKRRKRRNQQQTRDRQTDQPKKYTCIRNLVTFVSLAFCVCIQIIS